MECIDCGMSTLSGILIRCRVCADKIPGMCFCVVGVPCSSCFFVEPSDKCKECEHPIPYCACQFNVNYLRHTNTAAHRRLCVECSDEWETEQKQKVIANEVPRYVLPVWDKDKTYEGVAKAAFCLESGNWTVVELAKDISHSAVAELPNYKPNQICCQSQHDIDE